ncbi:MerR family transcriptional regulator [Gordonia hankookensis]|uniref:MerR family transcriptional regulator n=1 Tax=Gordonia hankookensis TaxID=589403 RepID=A0ABR7WDU4_9ACTN|nr:MerR family transcriptional regulator [Gordonia hankookensis]MBD1320042.1 MerR family transcriptional regulator [Gordonia hankookensis]NDZ95297.1 MerR family transcriptional regulator [Streptomyces sp. SID11726]NEB24451.1 MerR family transcriptional regulator [Streptomyces sp. SID6673]
MSTDHLMEKALAALGEQDGPLSVEVIHQLVEVDEADGVRTIAEAADLLGVSAHTLRYYERIGLVDVPRDGVGNRTYDAAAIRRLVFLTRMRLSGMAIRDLQHYVELVDRGDDTVEERLEMLLEHRDTVRRQIAELTLSLAATEYKIATYGGKTQP